MDRARIYNFIRTKILKTRISSGDMLDQLRSRGAKIGEDVHVYSTGKTVIDGTSPWLLTIGDHVKITEGVKILTHDYSWSVLKGIGGEGIEPGAVLGCQRPVEIGSRVFIGMNAIITCGVTIGDDVVIGAGSVVTRDCPSGGVYAGNPAKLIMSIEEFYKRRQACQFQEARQLALRYKERFGKEPPEDIFSEYFMLFCDLAAAEKNQIFKAQMGRMGNYGDTALYMQNHAPMFEDFQSFLNACRESAD